MIDAALLIELALKSVLVAGGTLGLLRLARHRSAAERSWIGHLGLVDGRRLRDPVLYRQSNDQLIGPIFSFLVKGNF